MDTALFVCLRVVACDVDVNLNVVFGPDVSRLLVQFVFGHQLGDQRHKPLERTNLAMPHSPVKIEALRIEIALPLV